MTCSALCVAGPRGLRRVGAVGPAISLILGLAVALAIASTLVLVITLGAVAAQTVLGRPRIRRWRAVRRQRRRRQLRHRQRTRQLAAADISPLELEDLATLADEAIEAHPLARDVYNVEELLDRYVPIAIARDRIHTLLTETRRANLPGRLAVTPLHHTQSCRVLVRRMQHAAALEDTAQRFDDAAAQLADLLRHYVERARRCELVIDGAPIQATLDSYDAAQTADLLVTEETKGA